MIKYYERLIDKVLEIELQAFGAVLISGPKWAGKTTTAKRVSNSMINLQDPVNKKNYLKILSVNPEPLLNGEPPMLIDEWQEAPQIWDYIRQTVDEKRTKGLYILTGSSSVDNSQISHSGAGRISRLLMRTLSLYESGHSSGKVSLLNLFNQISFMPSKSEVTIRDYAELVVRGGFPDTISSPIHIVQRQIESYINIITEQEIKTVYGAGKNPQTIKKIIRSLARHSATQAANSTILKDLSGSDVEIHRETLVNYIDALKNLFIIEDLPAWTPSLRSKASVRTVDTRYFIDPAIAARVLDANVGDLLIDFETFGPLFETLVIRDLRVYTESLGGHVSHYRDSYGYEANAVVHLNDGRWGLIEVKLGAKAIDEAAKNLLYLKETIKLKTKPSFLLIVTAGEFSYQREDGVYVVPIGVLKP